MANLHMEIPLALMFFAFMLSGSIEQNMVIYRACYSLLHYNESECALLGSKNPDNMTAHLEKVVEPYASKILMAKTFTVSLLSLFMVIFLTAWADKFGRKPILIFNLLASGVTYALLSILAAVPNASLWYLLPICIPTMMSGSIAAYLTMVLCYITDVTSHSNRAMRIAFFEAALGLGALVGTLSSSYLFYATNYATVFGISSLAQMLGAAYLYFFVPESLKETHPTQEKFKNFFSTSHIKGIFQVIYKHRDMKTKTMIIICTLLLSLFMFTMDADSSVMSLYFRGSFQWSLQKLTTYGSVVSGVWIFATIVGVYLLDKVLKIPETILILIGFIACFDGSLVSGLAKSDYDLYFAGTIHSVECLISPMIRSFVSQLVSPQDVGKLFSVIRITENLLGLLGGPLYTEIYNQTILTMPQLFNFISAGIYLFCIAMTVILIFIARNRKQNFEPLVENEIINEDICESISTTSTTSEND